MTAMRKKARETGVYLRVVKNTLASRAVAGTEFEVVQDKLVGPLLYAFSTEEPGAAGRLIKEFAKGNDKLQAKVVAVGGQLYPASHVEVLASLPTLRSGAGHAGPRPDRAGDHVRPRGEGRRPTSRVAATSAPEAAADAAPSPGRNGLSHFRIVLHPENISRG